MWEKAAINSNSRGKNVIQNKSACLFSPKFDIIEYIKKNLCKLYMKSGKCCLNVTLILCYGAGSLATNVMLAPIDLLRNSYSLIFSICACFAHFVMTYCVVTTDILAKEIFNV